MKISKFFALLLVLVTCFAIVVACTPEQKVFLSGKYVIAEATCNGNDVISDFSAYNVEFFEDGTMTVFISYFGIPQRRNSTYKFNGTVLTETNGKNTFTYTKLGENNFTTQFSDGTDTITVVITKFVQQQEDNTVDFESVLFGEDVSDTKKFNYCPAILMETVNGKTTMNIWYCTNKDSGIIMDHIGYRTGVLQDNGKWLFSEEQLVLAPTANTWDSRHTCDPAVIKGEFKMGGVTYNYLMSYLGCTTEDYQKNETGLAVAQNVGGPWVKVDAVNPIVPWYDDGDQAVEQGRYDSWQGTDRIYWGTGMPSLLSVDGKGEVILFYQSTLRGTGIRRLDLSNVDSPVLKWTMSLSSNGIVNSVGQKCNIGIPDFSYDPATDRLYVVSVTNEKNPADVTKTLVNSHSMVAYIEGLTSMEQVSQTLQSGSYKWNMVGYVGPAQTGWERNHNPGLVRDAYGYIPDSTKIGVVVSTGHNSWATENIFTYRLHGYWFNID